MVVEKESAAPSILSGQALVFSAGRFRADVHEKHLLFFAWHIT